VKTARSRTANVRILAGILVRILSGILSGILAGILSGILAGILFGILSGILFGILAGILFGILSGILSGILVGISIENSIASFLNYRLLLDNCTQFIALELWHKFAILTFIQKL
jgi:hypothetical protein